MVQYCCRLQKAFSPLTLVVSVFPSCLLSLLLLLFSNNINVVGAFVVQPPPSPLTPLPRKQHHQSVVGPSAFDAPLARRSSPRNWNKSLPIQRPRTSSTSSSSLKSSLAAGARSARTAIAAPTIISMSVIAGIIMVHELGHYLAAKYFQIDVEEFSIGMGPRIFGFYAFGNQFSFRAIPLGGYVKFTSQAEATTTMTMIHNDDEKTRTTTNSSKWLENRPWHERAIVYSGGIVFNMLLSYILYLGAILATSQGKWKLSDLPQLAWKTAVLTGKIAKAIAAGASSAILGIFYKFLVPTARAALSPTTAQFSGPVSIIKTGSDVAATMGAASMAFFAANISLNLGVINALPLPILDGGKLLLVLLEATMTGGRRNSVKKKKFEETVNSLTALLFMVFTLSVIWKAIFLLLFAPALK